MSLSCPVSNSIYRHHCCYTMLDSNKTNVLIELIHSSFTLIPLTFLYSEKFINSQLSTLKADRFFLLLAWNSLPDFIWGLMSSTDCFRHLLKIYLSA